MQHVTERNDVTVRALKNDIVLPGLELVVTLKEAGSILLENPGELRARAEDEPNTALEEDLVDDGVHLCGVCGEVEPAVDVRQAVIREERVDAEVAGVVSDFVNTRVREVREDVAVVEAGHGELGDDHLEEGAEGAEDTELLRIEAETCRRGEVATLHDTGLDEDLWMPGVDDLETSRALEIGWESGVSARLGIM